MSTEKWFFPRLVKILSIYGIIKQLRIYGMEVFYG
jgi:hypothetical protein